MASEYEVYENGEMGLEAYDNGAFWLYGGIGGFMLRDLKDLRDMHDLLHAYLEEENNE